MGRAIKTEICLGLARLIITGSGVRGAGAGRRIIFLKIKEGAGRR
jgi:hypothetical protein